MKRTLLTVLVCLVAGSLFAQKYAFVNSETVFKNAPGSAAAQDKITALQEQYQKQMETEYANLEALFQQYQNEKGRLSSEQRKVREQAILDREDDVKKMQEQYFGQEGLLAKKSEELFKPIQEKVQQAIQYVAKANGIGMVLDIASGMSIMYYDEQLDISDRVIETLRKMK